MIKLIKVIIFFFIIWMMNGCSSSGHLVQDEEMQDDFELIQAELASEAGKYSVLCDKMIEVETEHPLKGVEEENCFLPSRIRNMTYCSLLTPIEDVFGRTKADYHHHTLAEIEKLIKDAELKNRSQQTTLQVKNEKSASQARNEGKGKHAIKIDVIATAYNSVPSQTDRTPDRAAWGDRLKPGMKSIAVSRDLLKMGFTRGVKVKIEGLPGTYVVLDKMHKRWKKKIDIYMGKNVKKARNWGKRRVTISR